MGRAHKSGMKKHSSLITRGRTTRGGQPAQAGFTLLLAALVASIVLALGAAIFQIAQKQLTLSSIGRDSQFAFYVADTAAECALYWDFRFGYFATTVPATVVAPDPRCDGVEMNVTTTNGTPEVSPYYPYTKTSVPMDFFQDASAGGYCAEVYVTKSLDPDNLSAVRTVIHADGYNVNCGSILNSPRALQRSVELHY